LLAPGAGYVAIAWAWAGAYPIAFAALLWYALARCRVTLATYLRRIAGVVSCGAATAAIALAVHEAVPLAPLPRLVVVAAVVLVAYGGLLARIEKVTPRSIVRTLRGQPDEPAA
jgi:hypothetical protein